MKYDLTKCNNLNFRRGYNTGFLKVNEGKAYMYSDKKEWAVAIGAERHFYFGCAQLDELASEEDFEIIPRNPEKYEAWKVGDKVKKIMRGDDHGVLTAEKRKEIAKELGDVLWYVAVLANEIGFSLTEVAQMNYDKLKSRADRGKLSGDGDNR